MSNDEYKTSPFLNYKRFYFGQDITTTNSYCINQNNNSNNNRYQTVFPLKSTNKIAKLSLNTNPTTHKPTYKTYSNNNNDNNNNTNDKTLIDSQFVPMNLITNTGLDLSHSIRKSNNNTNNQQFSNYYHDLNNVNFTSNLNNTNSHKIYVSTPSSSSSSPSIDVENDDNTTDISAERIMSPVSIPTQHHHQHLLQQKPLLNDTRNPSQSAFINMELTAGSIPSGFPLNYQQLYANNAALYGAPVMFSGAIHAAHASYMAGLPLHAALSPNETYLKAIQAAACGIYSPTALAPPPPAPANHAPPPPQQSSSVAVSAAANPHLLPSKPSTQHNPLGSSMMALAPTSQQHMGIPKSPQHQYSPTRSITEVEREHQAKKDYQTSSVRLNCVSGSIGNSSNNTSVSGTYLNDKVNERLTSVDATKDSQHFKVPNGKEGSLKHRILRPPSSSDCSAEQNNKTIPVMRTYSTNSNFKKGNYIELANGALRRVEDMRTEDFIQCAERSPHHQLAESTVVKINTSLPTTAVITFSYDRNRSKVDMEISLDHPFFVYGQGWASCNPELSMKMFGLKCQRLQVGDICISLTKREQPRQQQTPPQQTLNTNQINDGAALSYQRRLALTTTVSSPNAANLKSPSNITYANAMTAHAFSIPVSQTNHHLQHQHHQQVQQQAYAEMAKLMSSYAYVKGLPQLPQEQLKEVVMDANLLQNLPPKMMSAFYQNHIYQLAQQQQQHQQQQEHLRQTELKNNQQRIPNAHYNVSNVLNCNISNSSHSPNQPTELDQATQQHHSQPPPQTQPLDVTMSRKRRWSAPENHFDDDESSETQPPRNGSSPATARS